MEDEDVVAIRPRIMLSRSIFILMIPLAFGRPPGTCSCRINIGLKSNVQLSDILNHGRIIAPPNAL